MQKQLPKKVKDKDQEEPVKAKDLSKKGVEIKNKLDDVIDEIDEILEKNAEEFVSAYIQKGGQ